MADWAVELPTPPSIYAFGALLDAHKRRRDLPACRSVVASAQAAGVELSTILVNTLISALVGAITTHFWCLKVTFSILHHFFLYCACLKHWIPC